MTIEQEKLNLIASKFNVKIDSVEKIKDVYDKISTGIKYQYLAHSIRTIEQAIRQKINSPLFQIQCVPIPNFPFASAQYFENKCYIIYFNSNADERQIRTFIAHELGHLFIEILANKDVNNSISEPLSSIFGTLLMLDKNNFYSEKVKDFVYSDWKEIIEDFNLLVKNKFLKDVTDSVN